MIPYGRQEITNEDIEAVVIALKSDFLTQGPLVPQFERTIAQYVDATHAVALCNATAALHVACRALNLGPGDRLWTSPITFVASANCALYCGAEIDFVDIDPRTYNMCPKALKEKLEMAHKQGRLPKIVVPVHMCGQSCDMASIRELANQYKFRIIEDASHAIGASYKCMPIGNSRYSDITIFSFHPVKIITTGEGGMAVTNDASLAHRMTLLRSHGITRDPAFMNREAAGQWYYEQLDLGYNYRITELQAALGTSQSRRLSEYVLRRRTLATQYNSLLSDLPVITPWQHPDTDSSVHLYVIRIPSQNAASNRATAFHSLRSKGIGVNVHYIPVHLQPYYSRMGFQAGDYPNAESYYNEAISLPIYPTLSDEQQNYIVGALRKALTK